MFCPFIGLRLVIPHAWPHYDAKLLWIACQGYPGVILKTARQPSGENDMGKEKKSNKEAKKKALMTPKEKKAAKKLKKEDKGLFTNNT